MQFVVVLDKQKYTYQRMEVKMRDGNWQNMVNKHWNRVDSMVRKYVDGPHGLTADVNKHVTSYNKKVARGDTIITYYFGDNMPMNVTNTRAPVFSRKEDKITFNFDGRFLDMTSNSLNHVSEDNQVWEKHQDVDLEQQFYISEATANSFIYNSQDHQYEINSQLTKDDFLRMFPEIKKNFGQNVNLDLTISLFAAWESEKIIQFREDPGVILGANKDMKADLKFYCSNSTTSQQFVLELEFLLELELESTFQDRFLFVKIKNGKIQDT